MKAKILLALALLLAPSLAHADARAPVVIVSGQARQLPPADTMAVTGTYHGLQPSIDQLRVSVGGFSADDQIGSAAPNSNAIVGAVKTPAGSYTGDHIFDSGVSGYAETNNTLRDAIGVFGGGRNKASGTSAYGMNAHTTNSSADDPYTYQTNTGVNVAQNWSVEADTNILKVSGSAPTGDFAGVVSVLNAEVQPTGKLNAFEIEVAPYTLTPQKWKVGLSVPDGTISEAALNIGTVDAGPGGPNNSQSVFYQTRDSGGSPQAVISYADGFQVMHFGAATLQVERGTNPAVGIYNTGTSKYWYLVNNGSGNLAFLTTPANATPLTLTSASVIANLPLQLAVTTYAALPTCNSGNAGTLAYISDASAAITTWNQTVSAGGGANKAFIKCDGSAWKSF